MYAATTAESTTTMRVLKVDSTRQSLKSGRRPRSGVAGKRRFSTLQASMAV
jgi:hypothetical protein